MSDAKVSNVIEPRTPRGVAARARLKDAGRRVLDRLPYSQMRVADVTDEAGVASGLFYRYFPDLLSLAKELLSDLLLELQNQTVADFSEYEDPLFERVRRNHTNLIRNFLVTPGLMRAFDPVSDADPAFRRHVRSALQRHLEFLITGRRRWMAKDTPAVRAEILMLGHAATGLANQCLRARYFEQDRVLKAWDLQPDEMAEWLTVLFYRAVTGQEPKAEWLRHADRLSRLPGFSSDSVHLIQG
jgi:AcrR family transcriptional regulator